MASPFRSDGAFPSAHVKLSVKLDDKNFKQWKQQIDGVVRGHKLQRFVTVPVIPQRSPVTSDPNLSEVTDAYLDWEQQDALVCTWLLSTISDSLLPKLVDYTHAWQVWTEVHRYFAVQLTTKARQLRSELRRLSKGNLNIEAFMARVREINDSLISVGDPVPMRNLIEIVLDALPEEYDSIVAAANSKEDLSTLEDLESSLLAHESRLEKHRKAFLTDPASVNLTQVPPSESSSPADSVSQASDSFPTGTSHVNAHAESSGYNRGGRSGRGGGRFGRHGGRFGKTQCQICHKSGHDTSVCYYRYTQSSPKLFPPQQAPFNPFLANARPVYAPVFGYSSPRPAAPRPSPPQAFVASSDPNFSNQWWYPDSGASHHVTPDSSNVPDAQSVTGSEQVFMGNGQGLSINSIGSMKFPSSHLSYTPLILHNLLLVPHITKNLISVSKFAQDNKVFFEFHPSFCLVKSQGSSEVLLHGIVGDDGLYKFQIPSSQVSKPLSSLHSSSALDFNNCNSRASCNTVSHSNDISHTITDCNPSFSMNKNDVSAVNLPIVYSTAKSVPTLSKYALWHTRLGHPHHQVLAEVLKTCCISLSSKSAAEFCSACSLGKSHRLPTSLSTTVYNHPFELVVCDLWGPAPIKSSGAYTYFLTCVDAFF